MVLFFLFLASNGLFGIDFFTGLGTEINGNSHTGVAVSADISAGVNFIDHLSAGLRFSYNHDMDMVAVLEPRAFIRFYVLPINTGFFIQGEAGCVIVDIMDDTYYRFAGGIITGYRYDLTKRFYIEPSIRIGYPYIWGIGTSIGFRFLSR